MERDCMHCKYLLGLGANDRPGIRRFVCVRGMVVAELDNSIGAPSHNPGEPCTRYSIDHDFGNNDTRMSASDKVRDPYLANRERYSPAHPRTVKSYSKELSLRIVRAKMLGTFDQEGFIAPHWYTPIGE